MRIPKSVTIKGHRWKVKRSHFEDDTSGLTTPGERLIELHDELEGQELEEVFWHEYCHALLHETHVTGREAEGGLSAIVEEVICDAFAEVMTNKSVWQWKRGRK